MSKRIEILEEVRFLYEHCIKAKESERDPNVILVLINQPLMIMYSKIDQLFRP